VANTRSEPRFFDERTNEVAIAHELGMQALDRDDASKAGGPVEVAEVHDAHPARADAITQLVSLDRSPLFDHDWGVF
jgi:hypothetical protein